MGCGAPGRVNPVDNLAAKDNLANSKLQDFEKEEKLGQGHFGEVHRVRHKGTGLVCAMKTVKRRKVSSKASEQEKRRRAEKDKLEAKILESMSHPFIVHLYKTFRNDEKLYIIMECLHGGELYGHLKKYGRFTLSVVKFYSAEILIAQEYLHKKSIVYRDMKPENVVVDSGGHVVLTDFGLAKHVEFGSEKKTYTFCGTPEYISPEIVNNEGYNHTSDWWSFGVLIYEMLCGFSPFRADNEDAIYKSIRAVHSAAGGLTFPKHVDAGTKDIISKLLTINVASRLGTRGADDIKKHKFYRGMDWFALISRQVVPPKLMSAGSIERS